MIRLLKVAAILLCAGICQAQGVRFDWRVTVAGSNVPVGANVPLMGVPNALVTICTDGNCITKASIFSNAGLSTQTENPITTDGQGKFGFWVASGSYFYKVQLPSGTVQGIFPVTVGGSGGGGSSGFPITLGSTPINSFSTTTAINGLSVDGVTLSTTGPATEYLDKTGNYSTPAGGGGGTCGTSNIPCTNTTNTFTAAQSITPSTSGAFNVGGGTVVSDAVSVFRGGPTAGHTVELQAQTGRDRTAFTYVGDLSGTPAAIFEMGTDFNQSGIANFYLFNYASGNASLLINPDDSVNFVGNVVSPHFNGVPLTATGSATSFLNAAGGYTVPAGGAVSSVFGRTGAVAAATNDYTIAQIAGQATGVAAFLGAATSANLAAALTDETGTGSAVFATSPTLVTPALGTPSSGIGTNITGLLYTHLPALSANQLLGALTATTPSGLTVPSCSGATNALIWTSGTGFGCNTISAGAVSSVSNSDSTLTVTPTTGAVVASLNLAHANTWTAPITVSSTAAASAVLMTPNGVAPAVVAGEAGWGVQSAAITGGFYEMPAAPCSGTVTFTNASGIVATTCATVIANTTTTVASSTVVAANTCLTATTVTMTGLATTSTINATPNSDLTAVTGWGSTGGLVLNIWPSAANTASIRVCNQTSASITTSAAAVFNLSAK